jgi:hypothetical protein
MSFAWYVKYEAPNLDPSKAHVATGIFLLAWTIFTVSIKKKRKEKGKGKVSYLFFPLVIHACCIL